MSLNKKSQNAYKKVNKTDNFPNKKKIKIKLKVIFFKEKSKDKQSKGKYKKFFRKYGCSLKNKLV